MKDEWITKQEEGERVEQYKWIVHTIGSLSMFAVPEQITIAILKTLESYHKNTKQIERVNMGLYYGKENSRS